MLDLLQIRNFRMLEDFSVGPLGRVNLIVGRNNSGKSTVLEALRLFAEGANPRLLFTLLDEHDELAGNAFDGEGDSSAPIGALRHLYPGRTIPNSDDSPIVIGEKSGYRVSLQHLYFDMVEEEIRDKDGALVGKRMTRVPLPRAFTDEIQVSGEGFRVTLQDELFEKTYWLDNKDSLSMRRNMPTESVGRRTPHGYVPTHFVHMDELALWWDQIVFTPLENRVINALAIIEPNVEGLAFVDNRGSGRFSRTTARPPKRIPVIKLRGQTEPIPLSSMGDGMLRVLQLVLATAPAKGGLLLVDEFENGLHFGVQKTIWSWLFQLATELDIQVFATTHSSDCVKSFTEAATEHPEHGVLFKMTRSRLAQDKNKVIAIVHDEERLGLAVETATELR